MNKEIGLIEKFRELEEQLVEILKLEGVSFDENEKKQVVKSQLKNYIKKVEKAKALFEEYEAVAKQIEQLAVKDKTSEVSSEVVALREDEIEALKEEFVNETVVSDGEVKTVKKKKKISQAKEF